MVDPATLAGTLVVVHVVNLPAFRERQMFTCPVDGVNPNRVFPGDPRGSSSEQLVYALKELEELAGAGLTPVEAGWGAGPPGPGHGSVACAPAETRSARGAPGAGALVERFVWQTSG